MGMGWEIVIGWLYSYGVLLRMSKKDVIVIEIRIMVLDLGK